MCSRPHLRGTRVGPRFWRPHLRGTRVGPRFWHASTSATPPPPPKKKNLHSLLSNVLSDMVVVATVVVSTGEGWERRRGLFKINQLWSRSRSHLLTKSRSSLILDSFSETDLNLICWVAFILPKNRREIVRKFHSLNRHACNKAHSKSILKNISVCV